MALTADQKEAIMAARGESAAAPAKSGTRRYDILFTDGKRATALDMSGGDQNAAIAGITSIFRAGYVVSVTPTP